VKKRCISASRGARRRIDKLDWEVMTLEHDIRVLKHELDNPEA